MILWFKGGVIIVGVLSILTLLIVKSAYLIKIYVYPLNDRGRNTYNFGALSIMIFILSCIFTVVIIPKIYYTSIGYFVKNYNFWPIVLLIALLFIAVWLILHLIESRLVARQNIYIQEYNNELISLYDAEASSYFSTIYTAFINNKAKEQMLTKIYSPYKQNGLLTTKAKVALEEERNKALQEYTITDEDRQTFIESISEKYDIKNNRIKRMYIESAANDYYTFINNLPTRRFRKLSEEVMTNGITVDQFFKFRQSQLDDPVGVYIIYNTTKNKYYVGQAKRLYFRVNQHFTGHGNGDVYADYKYGDQFLIKLIKLSDSGYYDLDQLEATMIKKYNAYTHGYNKTQGNHVM